MARRFAPASRACCRASRTLLIASLALIALPGCADDADGGGATETAGTATPAATDADATTAQDAPKSDWEKRAAAMEGKAEQMGGGVTAEDLAGAHPLPRDERHPDGRTDVKPALGGRVIMHLSTQPAGLAYTLENSWSTSNMLKELHASLLDFNWETWERDLELASRMDIEDTLILKGGRGEDNGNIIYGTVEEFPEHYLVTSGSVENPMEERRVAKDDVESLEKGTVFTFQLREGVKWHDGHPFDAYDVHFSWDVYNNPAVDCDKIRYQFKDIVHGEVLSPLTVRFFYKQQYFLAMQSFDDNLCILPRHLYDLADPENADHNPTADMTERGTYINDNPHNHEWVGLGPYKLVTWAQDEYVEAVRFDDYFTSDPEERGYLDTLRWRFVKDDELAYQALLNEEIDTFNRVKTEDYFGPKTATTDFTDNFYKTYAYTGQFGYTGWNLYSPKLSDVRVRKALTLAFDEPGWIQSKYKGLAVQVTGSQFFIGPGYDHSVEPIPYDPDKAEELLAEAGWYDRNGDGTVDKDGVELVIEWLMPSGNAASMAHGQKLQESFQKIGVQLDIQQLEWATFLDKIYDRDFEGCNLAWVLNDIESDPKQIWHSENAKPELRSSNHSGYADELSDELIDKIRVELDPDKRAELFAQLHQRVYELQPYIFGQNPPLKLAFNKKIRGIKLYHFTPGFRLRDMYYEEGTPGTRPLNQD